MTRTLRALLPLAVGFVGVLAGVAVANHQFPDVGNGSPFHDAIAAVNGAGCASGFPEGDFRPTEDVKRQQVAYWLDACLGRGDLTFGQDSWSDSPGDDTTDVELTVESGGLEGVGSGGYWMVMADADVDTSGDQQSTWELLQVDSPNPGVDEVLDDDVVTVLDAGTNPDIDLNPSDSATLLAFVPAPSHSTVTFRLTGTREGGVPLANTHMRLAALWVPFSAAVNL